LTYIFSTLVYLDTAYVTFTVTARRKMLQKWSVRPRVMAF